jgi:hypothetical protein
MELTETLVELRNQHGRSICGDKAPNTTEASDELSTSRDKIHASLNTSHVLLTKESPFPVATTTTREITPV